MKKLSKDLFIIPSIQMIGKIQETLDTSISKKYLYKLTTKGYLVREEVKNKKTK
jgi:hypothetical protein